MSVDSSHKHIDAVASVARMVDMNKATNEEGGFPRCTEPLCRGWVGLDCDGAASHEESEDEHNARVEAEERGELGVRL